MNIFTPDVPITENQQRLPVLVWFFGTTFTLTTSRDDIFGPDRFMNTKEVVIVTANYRTGPFGFLSLGIEECPGNQVRTISLKKTKNGIISCPPNILLQWLLFPT